MGRVGCMPCINCRKGELREISKRFPDQIDLIEEWEELVSNAAKRSSATMLPTVIVAGRGNNDVNHKDHGIRATVEWSKTTHGGKQYDIMADEPPASCSSIYGLCE